MSTLVFFKRFDYLLIASGMPANLDRFVKLTDLDLNIWIAESFVFVIRHLSFSFFEGGSMPWTMDFEVPQIFRSSNFSRLKFSSISSSRSLISVGFLSYFSVKSVFWERGENQMKWEAFGLNLILEKLISELFIESCGGFNILVVSEVCLLL